LLCAGPATLAGSYANLAGGDTGTGVNSAIKLVPIGLAMGVNLQINRQSSKIYEIGSRLGYTVSGRVSGGISISRALLNGANLLKVLYAGEVASDKDSTDSTSGLGSKNVKFKNGSHRETKEGFDVPAIGSGPIALNLDSAFFNHPFGLALIYRDQTDLTVSEHFFEGCVITSYSISISAEMNVLTEGINIEFTRIVPIVTAATTNETIFSDVGAFTDLYDLPIVGAAASDTTPPGS
jgi:hypothetical protein